MSEPTTYQGSCHCGEVRFAATMDLSKPSITCNCSICQRTGTVLSFIPAASFTLQAGEGSLTDYQFGKKHIHHLFCSHCGVRSFARGQMPDGSPIIAINVRCLEDVNLEDVPTTRFNGRAI